MPQPPEVKTRLLLAIFFCEEAKPLARTREFTTVRKYLFVTASLLLDFYWPSACYLQIKLSRAGRWTECWLASWGAGCPSHPDAKNIERLVAAGYRFLMPSAPRSFGVLTQGRKLTGRA